MVPGLLVVGLGWHARHSPAFIRGVSGEAELVVGHLLNRRHDLVSPLRRAS